MTDIKKGQKMYDFAESLFPICRSITGPGVRQTLSMCQDYIRDTGIQFEIKNVPSGTKVFDWSVPKEWEIHAAYIENEAGERIIDMADNNLHVMGYSLPVDEWVDLEQLKDHVFTLPDQPDLIPYVTSYYKDRIGFCMSQNQLDALPKGRYHMVVKSRLFDGNLTYAQLVLPGESGEEIFFSTYDCHPSMANNEVSGPVLMCQLIRYVASLKKRRYTYRFIIVPETIGSITYLATDNHLAHLKEHVVAGFNLSCVGDDRDYSIVHSKYGDTLADRVLTSVLQYHTDGHYSDYSFLKRGSDERQYNSAGVDLPVVGYSRSKFGEYPEYHTSADDMTLISPEGFAGSIDVMEQVVDALEYNRIYLMTTPCEPQLGKRGLFPTVSKKGSYDAVMAMMWFMSYADGKNDLIGISDIIGVPVSELIEIVDKLMAAGLVEARD